jgi:hypothetical protein
MIQHTKNFSSVSFIKETQNIYLDTYDMEKDVKLFNGGWFIHNLFNNAV